MAGNAVRTVWNTPLTFTSTQRHHAAGSTCETGPKAAIPALAKTTSIRPSWPQTASTIACMASRSDTSTTNESARSPHVLTTDANGWASQSTKTGMPPWAATARAVAAPIPEAAPVMSTTRSCIVCPSITGTWSPSDKRSAKAAASRHRRRFAKCVTTANRPVSGYRFGVTATAASTESVPVQTAK